MKFKRNRRLILMSQYLFQNPHRLLSFSTFTERFQVAKSTVSEDVAILKEQFQEDGLGELDTLPGAAGGLIYKPCLPLADAREWIEGLCEELSDQKRFLPGGYFYLTDILGSPEKLRQIGRIVASHYRDLKATHLMTIASKGIPFAQCVAYELNIPFLIVRRDSKVTEGPTISINYATKGQQRVENMELTKHSLKACDRVLLVDDFLNGGGTLTGMTHLVKEFNSECLGACVLGESLEPKREVPVAYRSLIQIEKTPDGQALEAVKPGTLLAANSSKE